MDKFTVLRTQTNFINGRESEQLASYVDSTVCSAIQDLTVEEVFNVPKMMTMTSWSYTRTPL